MWTEAASDVLARDRTIVETSFQRRHFEGMSAFVGRVAVGIRTAPSVSACKLIDRSLGYTDEEWSMLKGQMLPCVRTDTHVHIYVYYVCIVSLL